MGVPQAGDWAEKFNSDAVCYGGGGISNANAINSEILPMHQQKQSIRLTLPPLATIFLVLK